MNPEESNMHSSLGKQLVLVKGAGDLASGIAYVLVKAGYRVVMTETARPTVVRRKVAFAEAVYEEKVTVQGITAQLAQNTAEAIMLVEQQTIPVIIDPEAKIIEELKPDVVVDAIIAKKNLGTSINDAPLVIGIGPGFTAGADVDAVVESNRGPNLGKIFYQGSAEPNTGIPGEVMGYTLERVLRAPMAGMFTTTTDIGSKVSEGDIIGYINNEVPVTTQISGVVRGLLRSGLLVKEGLKLGDIEPTGAIDICYLISDKALIIGRAVLNACNARFMNNN